MRSVSCATILALVLLCAARVLPAAASQDASSFQDVPTSHWAYATISDLQRDGLIPGYTSGYFGGKRTLTRYEFAIALKRALDRVPVHMSAEGVPAIRVSLHVTADEVRALRRLVAEFQNDLTQLGETSKDQEACFTALDVAVVRSRPPLPLKIQMPPLLGSGSARGAAFPMPNIANQTPGAAESPLSLPTGPLRNLSVLNAGGFSFLPSDSAVQNLTFPLLGSRFALGEMATAPNAGLRLNLPLFHAGQVGLTLGSATTLTPNDPAPRDILAYGTDLQLRAAGHLTLGAAMMRTLAGPTPTPTDALAATDNDTYRINLGYKSGPANAIVGYQVIDPLQDNLANIQGPYTRLSYRFSDSLRSYLGGDYYTSVHTHGLGTDAVLGSLLSGNIYRGTAGVSWSPARGLNLSADYEGVLYDLSDTLSSSGRRTVEQYITLGAGLNLSRNLILKLAYQIANQQDSQGADAASTSVFTTQFAIHF